MAAYKNLKKKVRRHNMVLDSATVDTAGECFEHTVDARRARYP